MIQSSILIMLLWILIPWMSCHAFVVPATCGWMASRQPTASTPSSPRVLISASSSSFPDNSSDDWSCTVIHEGSDDEEEYCVLNDSNADVESLLYGQGDGCRLVQLYDDDDDDDQRDDQDARSAFASVLSSPSFWDKALQSKPVILTALAFGTYDPLAKLFSKCIQYLSSLSNNWVAVDGGAYQARIIAPAINGVVVPAMTLLFATMIATTINTLKQRQQEIQLAMHLEAVQLRILTLCLEDENNGVLIRAIPESQSSSSLVSTEMISTHDVALTKCLQYLGQYTTRLLSEADENAVIDDRHAMECELTGVVRELHNMAASTSTSSAVSPMIWNQALQACESLMEQRATRLTALQSTFPQLHFAVLAALGGSILLAFLMETDQDILVFLNAIQLRLLWSILVGTLSVLGLVCYDLSYPFRGSYQISKRSGMMDQLQTIRQGILVALIRQRRKQEELLLQAKHQTTKLLDEEGVTGSMTNSSSTTTTRIK